MNKKELWIRRKKRDKSIAALYEALRSSMSKSKTKLPLYEMEYVKWSNLRNPDKYLVN